MSERPRDPDAAVATSAAPVSVPIGRPSAAAAADREARAEAPLVAIVGNPNVGKSVIFGRLTGRYVTVSNYPGTTVEITSGLARLADRQLRVVDTPGLYSLLPISDEERVARRVLLDDDPAAVVVVIDAKDAERTLPLLVQVLELGRPSILVLNLMDEAARLGVHIDAEGLAGALGTPVVPAIATAGRGLAAVREALVDPRRLRANGAPVRYADDIEEALAAIAPLLPHRFARGARGVALLLLQRDAEVTARVRAQSDEAAAAIEAIVARAEAGAGPGGLVYAIAEQRQAACRALIGRHASFPAERRRTLGDRLGDLTMRPLTGVPILLAVLYFGLYRFVGVFAAGDVVDLLENRLFGERINPWFNALLARVLPGDAAPAYWARELLGGEYGVVTLGVTYAMAIVLPIVSLFFLFFSVLEDSGYFPRLAMLVDRLFKRIGLNGRAVIPIVLGLGCDTMATMVTRIQETRRERIITTLLLALAVPCAAQYGVVAGLLASQPAGVLGVSFAFLGWAGLLLAVFVGTGVLAARLVPGERAAFYMELPPIRVPSVANVVLKTLARMKWYFLEILPLFVLASVLIWIGRLTGLFGLLVRGLEPIVGLIGLPPATAEAFLYGFFRRDFGAAGLYQLAEAGALSGAQLLVSAVTLTLFLPCVAQLLIMKKERGPRAAALMAGAVLVVAFAAGGAVNAFLSIAGWMR